MAKAFYRQAVKALDNPYDVIDEVKFILHQLDQDFGFDTEFLREIRQMILNVEMMPYEYQEAVKIIPYRVSLARILGPKELTADK